MDGTANVSGTPVDTGNPGDWTQIRKVLLERRFLSNAQGFTVYIYVYTFSLLFCVVSGCTSNELIVGEDRNLCAQNCF